MTLVDRHLEFIAALRRAGLPVSTAEGLDGAAAVERVGLADRELLRAAYAGTLLKRHSSRPAFDMIFDLFFPAAIGSSDLAGTDAGTDGGPDGAEQIAADGPEALADFRERLAARLAGEQGDAAGQPGPGGPADLAGEAVQRFGQIAGRGPGQQRWSSYNVLSRVGADDIVRRLLRGLMDGPPVVDDAPTQARIRNRARQFEAAVEAEVRRRAAEVRGPAYVAQHVVRPSIEKLDFTSARRADLDEMRRQIQPLARRLATRLTREHHARRRGPLDFRRTVRASMQTGGVPITTHQKPKRPGRTDLVVLCDVSGSVANFAGFTLMLVYALREQFNHVRAFTFVDEIHEVSQHFAPGSDPAEVMAQLAASAQHATLWGRTSYGRAFTRFEEEYAEALTPRTNLLVLGDARSNYSDLALPVVKRLAASSRHAWWLNPEHQRHWNTGDSAAREYDALIPMVECRNLAQLTEFVHELA